MPQPFTWSPGSRRVFDFFVASATLLLVPAMGVSGAYTIDQLLLAVVEVVPLYWRRSRPVSAFAVVAVAMAVQAVIDDNPWPTQVALPIALYSVAAFSDARRGWAAMAVGFVGVPVALVSWVHAPGTRTASFVVTVAILLGVVVVAAWALGTLTRTRRAYVDSLVERGQRLELEAEQQAQLAALDERARIARDLHDVVAHGLSVIVVQADGARYAATRDPDVATRTLATIADTGRTSLVEMRRLLGLLRAEDTGRAPQPGLADLEALVAQARLAGMEVDASIETVDVPAGVGLTAYRVVQESLTNVRKHAGPSPHVHLVVRRTDGELEVSVTDDGRGATAGEPTVGGLGLLGMRERLAVYGGTLDAGPRRGGGFAVTARIQL